MQLPHRVRMHLLFSQNYCWQQTVKQCHLFYSRCSPSHLCIIFELAKPKSNSPTSALPLETGRLENASVDLHCPRLRNMIPRRTIREQEMRRRSSVRIFWSRDLQKLTQRPRHHPSTSPCHHWIRTEMAVGEAPQHAAAAGASVAGTAGAALPRGRGPQHQHCFG